MKIKIFIYQILFLSLFIFSCNGKTKNNHTMKSFEKGTFGYDLNYLSSKDDIIVLSGNGDKAQVIVSVNYQGKVFTSTANGLNGNSLGFVNYKALDSKVIDEHMNAYGGENRCWLGPEGGRYSIYFKPKTEQTFENWHTPKPIDIEAWQLKKADKEMVAMNKVMDITNYLGTHFKLDVDRTIKLISLEDASLILDLNIEDEVDMVAYSTENRITNLNDFEWTSQTGTICIWMLDMFNCATKALTIIPFNKGEEKELGAVATTDYFGEIPKDRIKIKDNVLYFKTDGKNRNKLGLNAKRSKSIAANYDADSHRLTITTFDVAKDGIYLNQEWNTNKNPLKGDAMNAYNDGPLEDGSIMGPFLEIESCSPGAFIKPNEKLTHKHSVFHFIGDDKELDKITRKLLGVSIEQIKSAF